MYTVFLRIHSEPEWHSAECMSPPRHAADAAKLLLFNTHRVKHSDMVKHAHFFVAGMTQSPPKRNVNVM